MECWIYGPRVPAAMRRAKVSKVANDHNCIYKIMRPKKMSACKTMLQKEHHRVAKHITEGVHLAF